MTSQRKQRGKVNRLMSKRGVDGRLEDRMWDRMPAVGREFGSPDFERLMEEDHRLGVGVFDPVSRNVADGSGRKLHAYEPDDGPLDEDQLQTVRANAAEKLPKGRLVAKAALFERDGERPEPPTGQAVEKR